MCPSLSINVTMATSSPDDPVPAILSVLRGLLGSRAPPSVAVVCGSGLSGLSSSFEDALVVDYAALPGFPRTTVPGHASELVFGRLGATSVVAQRGRFHSYEGWTARQSTLAVRVFAALGCRVLVVTNAAGGVNPLFSVGDIMVIRDHISLPCLGGAHPLVGANDARFGPRFPAVNGVYAPALQAAAAAAARARGVERLLRGGVYFHVSGPSYESPAEIDMMRRLGGDAVGMSTAPEVIVAAHCGMAVLGLSLITNACLATGDVRTPPSHEEVLQATERSAHELQGLVEEVVRGLSAPGSAAGEVTGALALLPAPKAAAAFAASASASASAAPASAAPAPAAAGPALSGAARLALPAALAALCALALLRAVTAAARKS